MKICKYGITLSLLRQEDIEFVSQKFYPLEENPLDETAENTSLFVQEWIDNIYNFTNFYYLIEYKGVKIGLINDKVLNWQNRTSENELVLWDDSYADTIVLTLATLCLLETGFYYLGWKTYKTSVKKDDTKEISTLKSLGYEHCEDTKMNVGHEYKLTRKHFETKAKKISAEARAYINEESGEGYLLLEAADYETGIAQKIEHAITESGIYLHRRGIAGGRKYLRKE